MSSFSYDGSERFLHDISMNIDSCSLVSIVGVFRAQENPQLLESCLVRIGIIVAIIKVNGTEHRNI